MKYKLFISVDQNDGDWNESSNDITQEQLDELIPVFKAIKGFKSYKGKSAGGLAWAHNHNWPTGECFRPDLGEKTPTEIYKEVLTDYQVEMFSDLCPFGENGFHTVESITVLEITNETKYL